MNKIISYLVLVAFAITTLFGGFFVVANEVTAQALPSVPTSEIPGSPLSTSAATTATNTTVTNTLIGAPGTTQAAIKGIRAALNTTCTTLLGALDKSDSVSSLVDVTSSAALQTIGGGVAESSSLSAAILKATAAKECIDGYVTALSNFSPPTLLIGNDLIREQDKFTKLSNSLRQIIEDLKARQSASVKDILKAFMVKLVLNLNKNLTTKLVNNMMDKYKIEDYLAYGDALSTQVYSMKYINEHYQGDARTQMMMRSLIMSEKTPSKAKTAFSFANQQAKEYVSNQCDSAGTLDATNVNSLNCLASLGNEQSSTMFKYLNALDEASSIKAIGNAKAAEEISQSNGFAPPRNCEGSVEVQTKIDTEFEQATAELEAAKKVELTLLDAYLKNQTDAQEAEYNKAVAATEAAEKKLADLGKQTDSPVIDICKAIDSPASFVGDQINNFLKQHLDQGSQLKSDNLPFYANFLSDVASNFLTNLLTGGKSTSKILKEAGTQGLAIGIVGASTAIGSALPGDIISENTFGDSEVAVYITQGGSSSKTTELTAGASYTINVNLSGYLAAGKAVPAKIEIRNKETNALVNSNTSVSGVSASNPISQYSFTAPAKDAVYVMQIFDASGKELKYVGFSFSVKGSVKGATITTTEFLPRGPVFSPR